MKFTIKTDCGELESKNGLVEISNGETIFKSNIANIIALLSKQFKDDNTIFVNTNVGDTLKDQAERV
jgi:hypothetical protein